MKQIATGGKRLFSVFLMIGRKGGGAAVKSSTPLRGEDRT
jgi:hypothetical protein